MDDEDILGVVLHKLGARDVARCRCVSPQWRRILSSAFFISEHVKAAHVVSGASASPSEALMVSTCWAAGSDPRTTSVFNLSVRRSMRGLENIGIGFIPQHVVNGLVLFARPESGLDPLFLLNPATGQIQRLPPPSSMERRAWKTVGMGYSPSTNQHKLFYLSFPGSPAYADVLTLGVPGGVWRRMEQRFLGCHGMEAPPAVVGGELCLLAKNQVSDTCARLLLVIDVASEAHRTCRLPDQATGSQAMVDLFDLHGLACVAVHKIGVKVDFLVLQRGDEIWELLYSFNMSAADATQLRHSAWLDEDGFWYLHGDVRYNHKGKSSSAATDPKAWGRQLQLPLASFPPSPEEFRINVFGGYRPTLLSPHQLGVSRQQDQRDLALVRPVRRRPGEAKRPRRDLSGSSGSNVAGDDAAPTRTPSRGVNLGPVLEDTPPRLRFAVGPCPEKFPSADAPGFITSIDDALARHADAQVDSLEISLVFGGPFQLYLPSIGKYATEHHHAALIKAEHVSAWLRYGMSRAAKCFVLEVPPEGANQVMDLDLPGSAVSVTMALTLGNATLTLPAPAEASYHALTDLLLSNVRIVDGDRLGELLSSPSLPRLKRLWLQYLVSVAELDLCVDELEELTIVSARDLRCLVVDAQCLRTLCVTDCSSLESGKGELAIKAPALQALTCANICNFQGLQFKAPSVREIGKLPLWTHGNTHRNKASISILKQCKAAHRLQLHLHVPNFMSDLLEGAPAAHSGMVDYESILVEEIPKLPNITALTVTISTWRGHSYAASLARLIAQCVNLEELHIDVKRDSKKPPCSDQACVCQNEGGWENLNFSLERLRCLNITGVQGLDYENRLTQMILASGPAIEKSNLPR